MRRGLMHWSHEEMPPAVLARRVESLQAAMRGEDLDAVLAYTSFAQPAVVHWLTHFTPYWSEAVLAVPAQGPVVLLAALTPRVHEWIRSVARIDSVVAAPRLGEACARWLAQAVPDPGARVGVIGRDHLPWAVAQAVQQARGGTALVEAAGLYRSIRQPADASEAALARHAAALCEAAWQAWTPGLQDTAQLTTRLEGAARLAGAEEVLMRIVPDLDQGAIGLRPEPVRPLATRHAVELSVAYKGSWVRQGRSVLRDGGPEPEAWAVARQRFEALLTSRRHAVGPAPAGPWLRMEHWQLEASVEAWPLSCVESLTPALRSAGAGSPPAVPPLPDGSLAVFSARMATPQGRWLRADPVVVDGPSLRVLAPLALPARPVDEPSP
jgi:hypothetical protein